MGLHFSGRHCVVKVDIALGVVLKMGRCHDCKCQSTRTSTLCSSEGCVGFREPLTKSYHHSLKYKRLSTLLNYIIVIHMLVTSLFSNGTQQLLAFLKKDTVIIWPT